MLNLLRNASIPRRESGTKNSSPSTDALGKSDNLDALRSSCHRLHAGCASNALRRHSTGEQTTMTTIENHSSRNYLNPTLFFTGQERLDDVLILLPSYKQPHPYTRAFVDLLVELGASVSFSWGCSDPALHRCILAGRAWR